jgi:hypothetical protein
MKHRLNLKLIKKCTLKNKDTGETTYQEKKHDHKRAQERLAAAVCLHIAVALELVAGKMRALDDSEQDLWA